MKGIWLLAQLYVLTTRYACTLVIKFESVSSLLTFNEAFSTKSFNIFVIRGKKKQKILRKKILKINEIVIMIFVNINLKVMSKPIMWLLLFGSGNLPKSIRTIILIDNSQHDLPVPSLCIPLWAANYNRFCHNYPVHHRI